jgi:hypothetical protein
MEIQSLQNFILFPDSEIFSNREFVDSLLGKFQHTIKIDANSFTGHIDKLINDSGNIKLNYGTESEIIDLMVDDMKGNIAIIVENISKIEGIAVASLLLQLFDLLTTVTMAKLKNNEMVKLFVFHP